jgi:hypothetical protein
MKRTRCGMAALAAGAATALACVFVPAPARADVTVSQKTVFDGFGERSFMANEGTSTMVVSGDKMRQESFTKFTGKLMKHFGGEDAAKSATITRIDRRMTYQVNYRDKSYTEIPFGSLKDFQKEMAQATREQAPAETKEAPIKCEPIRLEAKAKGGKQDVNGFPSEEAAVNGTQVCRNEETKKSCTNFYHLAYWATPVTPELREMQEFQLKLAAAMGIDAREAEALAQAARGMMSELGEGFDAVYKELSKVKGFPVRTRMTVEVEGSCGAPVGGAGEEGASPGMDEGLKAVGDRFKGLFGKKKGGGDEPKAAAKEPAAPQGRTKVFGMTIEVTSVSNAAAAAGAFEPPAGFAKKEAEKHAVPGSKSKKK